MKKIPIGIYVKFASKFEKKARLKYDIFTKVSLRAFDVYSQHSLIMKVPRVYFNKTIWGHTPQKLKPKRTYETSILSKNTLITLKINRNCIIARFITLGRSTMYHMFLMHLFSKYNVLRRSKAILRQNFT